MAGWTWEWGGSYSLKHFDAFSIMALAQEGKSGGSCHPSWFQMYSFWWCCGAVIDVHEERERWEELRCLMAFLAGLSCLLWCACLWHWLVAFAKASITIAWARVRIFQNSGIKPKSVAHCSSNCGSMTNQSFTINSREHFL